MKSSLTENCLKIVGLIASGLLVASCATPRPGPLAAETASRMHRIAVISIAAKTFTRQYTGLTVFGNEKDELDISDWNVDAQYEVQLSAELTKLAGITVVKAPYSFAEFAPVNGLNGPWDAPAFWGPNWGAIEKATKDLCAASSLDGLLVLAKTKTQDFLAGTNQVFGGAGTYARGPVAGLSVMHLISRIALLDCTSAKPLAIRTLSSSQSGPYNTTLRGLPMMPISEEISRTPIERWSEPQRQSVRNGLVALPTSAWSVTLDSIFPAR